MDDQDENAIYQWWRHRTNAIVLVVRQHEASDGSSSVTGAFRLTERADYLSDPRDLVWEDTFEFAEIVERRRAEFESFDRRLPFRPDGQVPGVVSDLGALGWE